MTLRDGDDNNNIPVVTGNDLSLRRRIVASLRGPVMGIFVGYALSQRFGGADRGGSLSNAFSTGQMGSSEIGFDRKLILQDEGGLEESSFDDGESYLSITENESLDEGEEDEESTFAESASILCIILLLILLTVGFEIMKESIEEHAGQQMEPMVESLFGEMTVLGFLSVFTFVVSNMSFFPVLSQHIFGEDEDDKLLEIFEFVHYTLFFVMIFFVVQVLSLEKQAFETIAQWHEMDRVSKDQEHIDAIREKYDHTQTKKTYYLPLLRNIKRELIEDQLMYHALRKEFILDRSGKPPFSPHGASTRLDDDFNFGSYLSNCLGMTLAHIVEVEVLTWIFFAVLAVFVFTVFLLSGGNMVVLAWVWATLGWLALVVNLRFEHHLVQVRSTFAPVLKRKVAQGEEHLSNGESTYLVPLDGSQYGEEEVLPAWCHIDLDDYMKNKRSWLVKKINGPLTIPDRHHTLFFFEKKGPKMCMFLVQVNLVFTGVYCAMLLLTFIQSMFNAVPTVHFVAYVATSVLPVLVIMGNKKHLVALMAQVTCIGVFRKPAVIADVIREEKTHRAVRTFVILCKMHRFAERGDWNNPDRKTVRSSAIEGSIHYRQSFNNLEISEVSKTFDTFDTSKDGQISTEEFESLMTKLGVPLNPEKLHNMVAMFDTDGDGEVSKEEFLQWYADAIKEDDSSTKEKAHFLFHLFDHDGSGEITIGEFKDTLEALNIGFTFDEVSEIIRELDEDGNGTIGEHEFEDLLEKYYPKEQYYKVHQQMKEP